MLERNSNNKWIILHGKWLFLLSILISIIVLLVIGIIGMGILEKKKDNYTEIHRSTNSNTSINIKQNTRLDDLERILKTSL